MLTVHEVAEQYGVSDAFMVRALDRIGLPNARPDAVMTPPTLARFETEFGDRIRAARQHPPPASTVESDAAPTASRPLRKPQPHVMRIAHARISGTRDLQGFRVKALLANPGLVHAMDAIGTREGDPWRGEVVPGKVHFFGGPINSGPSAACGQAHMRAVLGDEFVPTDDPKAAGQCPACAALVTEGKGFRNPPGDWYDPFCHAYLHVRINGEVEAQDCHLRIDHRGPHRTRDGATWDLGFDDFQPAPLDAGCRITKVS